MGLEAADLVDDAGGGKAAASVSCSICLEVVAHNGDRSWAKLQCGHQFHLDCIGSAFNVKGVMQCPNCRKTEKGQWLFANGCRSYPEFSMDDWAHDEDLYDLSYTETTSMWCPFGGFTRLAAASFDDGEFPTSAAYHDLVGQHAIFSEHSAAGGGHLCPYFGGAYVQPSTSSASVADGPTPTTYNHWNSSSSQSAASSEMSYALPTSYHSSTLFPPPNNHHRADQPSRRPVGRNNTDIPASYAPHPFLVGQSSGARVGGSSMIHHPQYPGSAARARERAQALQAYFQQPTTLPMVSQRRSSSDQIHGGGGGSIYYLPTSTTRSSSAFQEPPETSMPNPYTHIGPAWAFHQPAGASAAVFRVRHGSERTPSQGQGRYRS